MAINFIVNDPLAADPAGSAIAQITASPNPGSSRTRVVVDPLVAQNTYPPGPNYIAWQAREAALRTIEAVEQVNGPLPVWAGRAGYRDLPLVPVAGQELNAYYDRNSVSFFITRVGGTDIYSGASTDVVAHEVGHAILDAVRPDLWGVNMMEVGAFHEGFGDIVAIHTALADRPTRMALLAIGLRNANYVEAVAEQLSDAIRQVKGAAHPASAPRRALNDHKWSFPTSLPANGPPAMLINEEHSLGQLASGVYYDLVCELYDRRGAADEQALWEAAKLGFGLCLRAIKAASVKPRFFEAWGRAMTILDAQDSGGANMAAIVKAFDNHGILLNAATAPVPRVALVARRSGGTRATKLVTNTAKVRLRSAMGLAAGDRLAEREVDMGTEPVVEVSSMRAIDLTGVAEALEGVSTMVQQTALVGRVGEATALVSAIDSDFAYGEEVRAYVASLVAHDNIALKPGGKSKASGGAAVAGSGIVAGSGATHVIVTKAGQKLLERRSFACGCGRGQAGRR